LHLRQVVRRLAAALRDSRPGRSPTKLVCGDVVLDLARQKVTREKREIAMSKTGFRLLHTIMEEPERVYSREQLLLVLRGRTSVRTVDVHMARLRKALTLHGGNDVIRTVRGSGYAFSIGRPEQDQAATASPLR
jgi:two-component system phosphate regulon response regulator PhoB